MDDLTRLQERLAHLERAVEDMSGVIARQDSEIAVLTRRVAMLMSREAERQADAEVPVDRPPHY